MTFPLHVESNVGLFAHWERVRHSYRVAHYQQNIDDDGYTLAESEDFVGDEGCVELAAKDYAGFTRVTPDSELSQQLTEDGQEFAIYYDRTLITISFEGESGDSGSLPENLTVRYGTTITLPDPGVREGYTFAYWHG